MIKILAAQRLAATKLKALSQIKIADLKTRSDCYEAEDMIKSDYRNVVGGAAAWNSGKHTELTPAAKKKLAAIEKLRNSLPYEEDEDD
jgi:hypothetical protein